MLCNPKSFINSTVYTLVTQHGTMLGSIQEHLLVFHVFRPRSRMRQAAERHGTIAAVNFCTFGSFRVLIDNAFAYRALSMCPSWRNKSGIRIQRETTEQRGLCFTSFGIQLQDVSDLCTKIRAAYSDHARDGRHIVFACVIVFRIFDIQLSPCLERAAAVWTFQLQHLLHRNLFIRMQSWMQAMLNGHCSLR